MQTVKHFAPSRNVNKMGATNKMVRSIHTKSYAGKKPTSTSFLFGFISAYNKAIDAAIGDTNAQVILITKRQRVWTAIQMFRECYRSGDITAHKAVMYCRLNSIPLQGDVPLTMRDAQGAITMTTSTLGVGHFNEKGEHQAIKEGSIRVTHNLKGSDTVSARFSPNSDIVGAVPLKQSITGKIDAQGMPVKDVRWNGDTRFKVTRNTFLDKSTGKNAMIPASPVKRDKFVR